MRTRWHSCSIESWGSYGLFCPDFKLSHYRKVRSLAVFTYYMTGCGHPGRAAALGADDADKTARSVNVVAGLRSDGSRRPPPSPVLSSRTHNPLLGSAVRHF